MGEACLEAWGASEDKVEWTRMTSSRSCSAMTMTWADYSEAWAVVGLEAFEG